MNLHNEIINLNAERRKQNLAIDEAMKKFKNLRDIFAYLYARGHKDARHAAAELVAENESRDDE